MVNWKWIILKNTFYDKFIRLKAEKLEKFHLEKQSEIKSMAVNTLHSTSGIDR